MTNSNASHILKVKGLKTRFYTKDEVIHAVNGVSFQISRGELLGVVGESGCGKSVTMMSLLKLLPMPPAKIVAGTVDYGGQNLLDLDKDEIRNVRGGKIGFVFQDPLTSLNPVFTVGFQLMEPLRIHLGLSRRAAREKAVHLLELVGIPEAPQRLNDFPHQFSGGMRQRVMIAIALSCDPQLLIADEPTTALDVTVQAQFLELILKLRKELGMGIIWITHDLGVVAGIADRVLVMYGGLIVESAPVHELYEHPRHPYTRALLKTLPNEDENSTGRLLSIQGQPPNLVAAPKSCPFSPRCQYKFGKCERVRPPLRSVAEGHEVACWLEDNSGESYRG
jgi:peptide/nickel transport system ATP-binding protein/oligopeptide transport system ATP-binding protein